MPATVLSTASLATLELSEIVRASSSVRLASVSFRACVRESIVCSMRWIRLSIASVV
jgi:hypothetical protein